MKDDNGLYYYPFPANKQVRMYVRQEDNEIFFRLWDANQPQLWEEHGWLAYGAIAQAMKMYQGKAGFDPKAAYDLNIAKELIEAETRYK